MKCLSSTSAYSTRAQPAAFVRARAPQSHASTNAAAASNQHAEAESASRRLVLGASAAAVLLAAADAPAQAVQGLTAGRIPGLAPDPEMDGFNMYKRPAGKSGGHGVGWSEIPQVRL